MVIEVTRKPLPIRALNGAYRAARGVGLRPGILRKAALMERASKQAGGLTDFGDTRFEVGLDRLIDSIESEDRLNGLGRVMANSFLTSLLRQRLLVTEHLVGNPGVYAEKIERPIFIVGAPRTGTTILHHLLSQDSRLRYPITWECNDLYPPLDPATMMLDRRIRESQKGLDRVLKLAPTFGAAHPVGAWEAQECVLLHAHEFASMMFHPMFNCQSYDRWLVEQDLTWVYEAEKVNLQFMQSGGLRPQESWLLKAPAHMENIDNILAVFPDARFITTYREPTEIIGSGCSLTAALMQIVQDDVDWHDHGRHINARVGGMLGRNVEQRRRLGDRPDQFIDFSLEQIVKDPLACVAAIYGIFGIVLDDANHTKMAAFMREHTLSARTPHVYDASDYGIDVKKIWHDHQDYRDFYNIKGIPS